MGTSRHCGPRCHHAKEPECDCWCAGLFHGDAGAGARAAFVKAYGEVPTSIDDGNLFWQKAIAAANGAHAPNPCKPSMLVVSEGRASYLPCAHCGRVHRPARKALAG